MRTQTRTIKIASTGMGMDRASEVCVQQRKQAYVLFVGKWKKQGIFSSHPYFNTVLFYTLLCMAQKMYKTFIFRAKLF